ncbi:MULTISPECIES: agmatine deiminase family protein [Myxococcaceae]|uniref:agmatine deiminase family protein n=1 Tax=Myxococcaceae TaxID=31 RepID=UPI00188DD73C|nr:MULTISPECIES: agmatine deiminase family protein [Myxococcaceae]MBF5044891.1 agmatine deiminase family protein [Simulacricoccus sp. 17bor-14]
MSGWLAASALVATACGPTDESELAQDARVTAQEATGTDQVLPRWETAQERQVSAMAAGDAFWAWQCDPSTYQFTSVGTGARFPTEAESTTGVLIGWPDYGCTVPELAGLVKAGLQGNTQVSILTAPNNNNGVTSCLRRAGLTDAQLARVEYVPVDVDSVWIRDYGPEILTKTDGSRRFVDMSYYPVTSSTCSNMQGRVRDDASPTRLAAQWNAEVVRPKLRLEGGNLQTDGKGTCFRAQRNAEARNNFSEWQYTPDELNEVIGAAHNCKVQVMESLVGGVIDHIDMFMTVISSKTILVGQYDPADDATNAAILDRNAAKLAGLGYRVVRVPMPKTYCRKVLAGCYGQEQQVQACDGTNERVWATYMNSIRLGNVLAVPVFKWVPAADKATVAAQEAKALSIYQSEMDREFGKNKVKVVTIQGDGLIPCQGSLHCTTMTYK